MKSLLSSVLLIAAACVLTACGGGGGGGQPTGQVQMSMTDAPTDSLTKVHLTITEVALKPANGDVQQFTFDKPLVIDNLLDFQGGKITALLPQKTVPAGKYDWIRFYVESGPNNSYVVNSSGSQYPLYVPGQQNAPADKSRFIQLVSGFTIPAGGQANFIIDTDLRRAIVHPSNANYYLIRPAMRLLDNTRVGTISGTVADNLTCPDGNGKFPGNDVYLFTGDNATPGDIYVDDKDQPLGNTNPVTTTGITQQSNGSFTYKIAYVPPGDYTVAFTCDGAKDNPTTQDSLTFKSQANVTVTADQTATANLQ